MSSQHFEVVPIGRVESPLVERSQAPRQGMEGAPSGRPNPIGLHRVEKLAIEGLRTLVSDLEAIDTSTIVDVKPSSTEPQRGRRLALDAN